MRLQRYIFLPGVRFDRRLLVVLFFFCCPCVIWCPIAAAQVPSLDTPLGASSTQTDNVQLPDSDTPTQTTGTPSESADTSVERVYGPSATALPARQLWYVSIHSKVYGPYSATELWAQKQQFVLRGDTLVAHANNMAWAEARILFPGWFSAAWSGTDGLSVPNDSAEYASANVGAAPAFTSGALYNARWRQLASARTLAGVGVGMWGIGKLGEILGFSLLLSEMASEGDVTVSTMLISSGLALEMIGPLFSVGAEHQVKRIV